MLISIKIESRMPLTIGKMIPLREAMYQAMALVQNTISNLRLASSDVLSSRMDWFRLLSESWELVYSRESFPIRVKVF